MRIVVREIRVMTVLAAETFLQGVLSRCGEDATVIVAETDTFCHLACDLMRIDPIDYDRLRQPIPLATGFVVKTVRFDD
jgi:hypothetical protein